MGTRTSSLIISHHAGPGLTQGPGIQFTGAQDPAHRGLGSSSWGLGIQLTWAQNPAYGGSGFCLPVIWPSQPVFTQKGRGARRCISARTDSWFALTTIPSGNPALQLLSALCVYCPRYRPVTKCVLCNAVTWQDDTRRELAYKDSALYGCLLVDFKILVPH